MRVLVTGHAGYIGQHLVRELEAHDHEVVGHDRAEGDLTQPGVLGARLNNWRPDRVIHLAARYGRMLCEADPIDAVRTNASLTTLVARECRRRGIPVTYTSSSEVYGDHGNAPCYENSATHPHNIYGMSKLWGEQVLRLYAPRGLQIMRLSMPYGPGKPPGYGKCAMDNFLWWAHHRQPIVVHQGSERCWTHVSDAVCAIRLIVEYGATGTYNVCRDDQPILMVDLARKACVLAGADESLIHIVPTPGMTSTVKRTPAIPLRHLGWVPRVDLDEGMPGLLEWVRWFPKAHYRRADIP
jgi:nucleoside-diphosphate-sugar epimerase